MSKLSELTAVWLLNKGKDTTELALETVHTLVHMLLSLLFRDLYLALNLLDLGLQVAV